MSKRRLVTGSIFGIVAASIAVSSDRVIKRPEVGVGFGETVVVEFEPDKAGKLDPTIVAIARTGYPSLTFKFTQVGPPRELTIESTFKTTVEYSGRMCFIGTSKCVKTTFMPVPPGIQVVEAWRDPIDLLILRNFRVKK
jgi:hypothetical protein